MAEYIKQEMSDLDGSGEQRVFYRMKTYHNINAREFVSKLARPGSGLSEGNVLHVLTTLADELAYYMAQGYSVSIDGVGTFKPTLGIAEGKETDTLDGDEQKRNARSIMVNGVNFRASKDLIKETARHCELKRAGVSRIHHSPYSPEERITLALKYLDENHFMRVADYIACCMPRFSVSCHIDHHQTFLCYGRLHLCWFSYNTQCNGWKLGQNTFNTVLA